MPSSLASAPARPSKCGWERPRKPTRTFIVEDMREAAPAAGTVATKHADPLRASARSWPAPERFATLAGDVPPARTIARPPPRSTQAARRRELRAGSGSEGRLDRGERHGEIHPAPHLGRARYAGRRPL